jgi:polyisoprenoid-binding protein YceI
MMKRNLILTVFAVAALAAGTALAQAPGGAPPGGTPGSAPPAGPPGGGAGRGGPQMATGPAASGTYKVDINHSHIEWTVLHRGMSNYAQRFWKYDVTVTLDRDHVEKSKVNVTIDPTSLYTGMDPAEYRRTHGTTYQSWEDQLSNSDGFFNAKKFPTITFTSTKVEKTGDKTAKVTGDLTFLGMTKPMVLDVSLNGENPTGIGFHATGTLNRTDFGLTSLPTSIVSADVKIEFDGEFRLQR